MTREEAKQLLPIMQAFAEGKTVLQQVPTNSEVAPFEWVEIQDMHWCEEPSCYRIKPEPTYRPFKDAEECWQEMQKHQPFGWLKDSTTKDFWLLDMVRATDDEDAMTCYSKEYTFADGEPFGVKEEEYKNI